MTTSLAPALAPRQLDIINDTALRAASKTPGELSTKPKTETPGELSTSQKSKTPGELSTTMAHIDRRRRELSVTVASLCSAAGIHGDTYEDARAGRSKVRLSTVRRLEQALDRFAIGYRPAERLTIGEKCMRDLMVEIAVYLGLDPETVLAQDYSSEKTNDDEYMRNCNVRRCAIYLMVEGMRFPKAAVARVAGFSRQAAHKTVTAIERKRQQDTELDKLLGDMMLKARGERI
ncbi:hypothetical protein QWJ07_31370 [Frankia sp. RB7]|nr:hypothetical protein [Frankia sp. RB7]